MSLNTRDGLDRQRLTRGEPLTIEEQNATLYVSSFWERRGMTNQKSYRVESWIGDIVKMPCGTFALVTDVDFDFGGNCKILTLSPFSSFLYRLFLSFMDRLNPGEEQIDRLVKVGHLNICKHY
ncbi:MAG: hypothetical protein A3A13_03505 [Candidatus Yanofskybacteria bacterium RIFCSPLOWO2_01_FULL_43_22]|uniref:Uncharacterized protein n=1 Tax=Candidatus Yanofskybacteria bacterium RIFCSPLOWO2_01_FULL_43_22 TaxID=1802695 RepID=A0A1F8GDT5_9BACT|nr:MAG: hypothetical protein A3D48_00765 [Candidatus Yanofskybacteria bacterium RIFCSPHIGHO2_02_FULL_43_17]OGN23451.1 MAG: hypothetical protein A3A13_03505 [Candidatus Yanofskybacteria bacterium RIFCSPLOWO2_01_FULL_43_22]